MQAIFRFVICAFAMAALACGEQGGTPESSAKKIVITGSSTVAPLISEIARRFEQEHPDFRVDVQTGGSSRGIADARSGTADLGMISRPLKDDEQDLRAMTLARDGIAMIVHADNPLASLEDAQVAAIYRGEIENWSEVGGPDAEITVVNKAEGRATLEVFLGYFGLENTEIQPDVIIGHNEQGIKTVAGNPHSIGYVSIGVAETDIERGVSIRLIAAEGVEISADAVADGRFPISRPLNLVIQGVADAELQTFIDYCLSEAVHDLIEAQRFVPSRG